MDLDILPLSAERWPDLESLFGAPGCSVARGCWCMYYRESGRQPDEPDRTLRERRREALRERTLAGGLPPGLLGYRDGRAVGWVSLAPREDFPRLRRSPVARAVDGQPVWSIVCFVVPPALRHQGVASALLHGAVAFAREHGAALLEAYPVDKAERGDDDWMWNGALSMYRKAGFVEVARRRPERPVVRLALPPR